MSQQKKEEMELLIRPINTQKDIKQRKKDKEEMEQGKQQDDSYWQTRSIVISNLSSLNTAIKTIDCDILQKQKQKTCMLPPRNAL